LLEQAPGDWYGELPRRRTGLGEDSEHERRANEARIAVAEQQISPLQSTRDW
jgi:hypothetical protein